MMLRHTDDLTTLKANESVAGVMRHHHGDNGDRMLFEVVEVVAGSIEEERNLALELADIDAQITNLDARRGPLANRLMELQLRRQLQSGSIRRRAIERRKTMKTKLTTAAMFLLAMMFASTSYAQTAPTVLVLGTGDLGIEVPAAVAVAQVQTYRAYKDGGTTGIVLKGALCEAKAGATNVSVCWAPLSLLGLTASHSIQVTAAIVAADGELESAKVALPFVLSKVAPPVAPTGTGSGVRAKIAG